MIHVGSLVVLTKLRLSASAIRWSGGLVVTPLQDHKTTRPQDHKTTRPQDHKTTRPQDHKTTRPQIAHLYRLLRLPNLAIVALTQALVYYYILRATLRADGIAPGLSPASFWELTGATVLVSAAGYLINDLFDRTADRHNRVTTPYVEQFGVGRAWWLYGILVLSGAVLSIDLARRLDEWEWLWLYPLATLLLAAYSPYIKPRPFWGNLLVALYCAGVPGIVWLGERESLALLSDRAPATAGVIDYTLILFMVFAFTVTLLREIVKDLEDRDGDRVGGRRTLPLVWGEPLTRRFALGLGLALGLFLPFSLWWGIRAPAFPLVLAVLLLAVLLAYLLVELRRATLRPHYGRLSRRLKWFMLAGLLFLLLFRWYR